METSKAITKDREGTLAKLKALVEGGADNF